MSGRWRVVRGWSLLAVGILPGCGSMSPHKEATPHATAALLDSGPSPRMTARQTSDVQFAIGRSAEESDQLDQAVTAYKAALANSPKRVDIEHRLAVVLDQQGRTAEADDHFAHALKLAPKDVEILCDRGYSYHLRGQTADAERTLRSALALRDDHARSHTNLGLILANRGQVDAALAEFSHAGSDPADARANLALGLALGGHLEAAGQQYARAATAKPTSKLAQEGQKVVAAALKAQAGSGGKGNLPALPGEGSPTLVASRLAPGGGTVDSAVQPAGATAPAR